MQSHFYQNQKNDVLLLSDLNVSYAGFWSRAAASFIDFLILTIPYFLQGLLIGESLALSFLITWLYFAVQESGPNQATIGKKAMGIKVLTTYYQPLTFANATGRHFSKFISSLIFFTGYITMLWDGRKQNLHDKIAQTIVVKA